MREPNGNQNFGLTNAMSSQSSGLKIINKLEGDLISCRSLVYLLFLFLLSLPLLYEQEHFHQQVGLEMEMEDPVHTVPAAAVRQ